MRLKDKEKDKKQAGSAYTFGADAHGGERMGRISIQALGSNDGDKDLADMLLTSNAANW